MNFPSDSDLHDIIQRVVRRTLMGENIVSQTRQKAPAQGTLQTDLTTTTVPPPYSVAVGADHGGFDLKQALKTYLTGLGYSVIDCGTHSTDPVDYPDFAFAVALLVSEGKAWRGIIVDGAGIGSCMVANKVPGVRASLCYDQATATNSREHNNANVLTLGAKMISENQARHIVNTWLTTLFGGGRHARRVDKIMEIEKQFLK